MQSEKLFQRLALLAELSRRARLGRTAIMKLSFFLQESLGVPLGYDFSLYSYGPFDSDVLADITTAERLNVLKSSVEFYPSGSTGYLYSEGSDAKSAKDIASRFLAENEQKIQWVLTHFGNKNAGELELLSTILFVAKFHNPKDVPDLVEQVKLIKPHFSPERIESGFNELVALKILRTRPAGQVQ